MTPPHKKKLLESAKIYSTVTTGTTSTTTTNSVASSFGFNTSSSNNGNNSSKRMRVAENSTSAYSHYLQNSNKLEQPAANFHHYYHQHFSQQPQYQTSSNHLHNLQPYHRYSSHKSNNLNSLSPEMYFFSSKSDSSDFSTKKCRIFFRQYAEHDSESIGPSGIEKLCQDLGVRPEEAIVLALSWKLNAKVMGIYTLEEWLTGMRELKCDNINKLKNKLGYLKNCLDDSVHFRSIFRFSYEFVKEPEQRCIDIETAKQMLTVLFQSRWPLLNYFIEFLNQSHYKVINRDQYYNVLDFFYSVNLDLTNYDENGAWPVMLDEFVEWCRSKKNFKRNNASN